MERHGAELCGFAVDSQFAGTRGAFSRGGLLRAICSAGGEYELTDAITGLIATHHPLAGLRIEGRWVDVRNPEVLAKLEAEK